MAFKRINAIIKGDWRLSIILLNKLLKRVHKFILVFL